MADAADHSLSGTLDAREADALGRLRPDHRIRGRVPVADLPSFALRIGRARVLALVAAVAAGSGVYGLQPESEPPAIVETPDTPEPAEKPVPSFVMVEGQITDDIGAGQQGVTVTVRRKVDDDGNEAEVIATVTTDKLGDFRVTVAEPVYGDFVVTFRAPKYAEVIREINLDPDDAFPPYLAETLEGNLIVIGRVIDALTSKPVAGAVVMLTSSYREWRQKSDEEGRFTIKGVSPGKGELIVSAETYGRQRQRVDRLEDFGEIVVSLKPERLVHLTVVDKDDQPISGVTVECYDEVRDDFRTLVTDETGTTTFSGLHFDAARLSLRLTHPGHVSSQGFDRNVTTPTDKTESTHRLVMVRGGRVMGRVTDTATGKPLYGARVMTGDGSSDQSPRDWTDYEGRYEIHGVAPGPTVVTVHQAGYAPDLKTAQIEGGKDTMLDLRLDSGTTLKGVVRGEDAKPVPGAYIDATEWRGHATLGLRAVSDSDGQFVIENAPHDEFEITVFVPRGGEVKKTVKADPDATVEITLSDLLPAMGPAATGWLLVGDTAPVLTVTTLAGKTLKFADLKGKTILLDFWATWCGPCVVELPHLAAVYKKHGTRDDFVMIGISIDGDEQVLRDFLKKRDVKWHQVFGEAGGAQKAARRYGVSGVPALFLIGPDGKLAAAGLTGADIEKKVEEVLAEHDPT